MPSPNRRIAETAVLVVSAVLSVFAWVSTVSLRHPVSAAELIVVTLLFGSVPAVIGFRLVRQHRRYFGSSGRFWLEIDRSQLTVMSPDGPQTYAWRDLTRFAVEEDKRSEMNSDKHVADGVTIYVTAVDAGPNSRRLTIMANDFATKLPGNGLEQAQRFCAILNDLRNWAVDSASHVVSRRAMSGLVVAPA